MDTTSVEILRVLLNMDGVTTTQKISDMTGFSVSSIKKRMPVIRQELKSLDIELHSSPQKGIFPITAGEQARRGLEELLDKETSSKADYFEFRKDYIIDTLLNYPIDYTIQMFAEELSVSRHVIFRDIRQIDQELHRMGLSVNSVRKKGVFITGNESNIRQAIVSCNNARYWDARRDKLLRVPPNVDRRVSRRAYTYLSHTYTAELVWEIQNVLRNTEKKLGILFTDVYFVRLIEHIAVTVNRIKLGSVIKEIDEAPDLGKYGANDQDLAHYRQFLKAAEDILMLFCPSCQYRRQEALFLCARMFVSFFRSQWKEEKGFCREDIRIFLMKIGKATNLLELSNKEELLDILCFYFEQAYVREKYKIFNLNEIHKDVSNDLTALYMLVMIHISGLAEKYGFFFDRDEIARIAVAIHYSIAEGENKVKGVLVHGTDEGLALYFKSRLESSIPDLSIVRTMHYLEFHPQLLDKYLVISTIPMLMKNQNLVEVTKHFDQRDLSLIQSRLEVLRGCREKERMKELLDEVLDENLVVMNLNTWTKEETLESMSILLEEAGAVCSCFRHQLLKEEAVCSSYIGQETAIPHIFQRYVLENKIVVALLPHKINWDNESKVRLIFMMALQGRDTYKFDAFFNYLYKLLGNKKVMEELKLMETPGDLLRCLKEAAGKL